MPEARKDRLDSWKAIADFLGRDVRTVIRWEKEKGLPVHRVPGGRRGSVFAYRDELEGWMLGGSHHPGRENSSPPSNPESGSETQECPDPRTPLLRFALFLPVALLLLTGFYFGQKNLLATTVPPLEFTRTDYEGQQPLWVRSADVNSDGHADVVFTLQASDKLAVLLGKGDGTFRPKVETPTDRRPGPFAIADLDGDGTPDVALIGRQPGELAIYLGNGNGTFRRTTTMPFDPSQGIVAGDFNRDGKMDLAACRTAGKGLSLFFGRGDGTFSPGPEHALDGAPGELVAADFNKDGILDLATPHYSNGTGESVWVLLGRGDGTFGPPFPYPSGKGPLSIAAADLNGDGNLDLVTANFRGSVSVMLGNGDGSFAPPQVYAADSGAGTVGIGDFDGDGAPDLAVLSLHVATVSVYRSGGSRKDFQPPLSFLVGQYPTMLAIADFDHDGKPDLAVTNAKGNSVSILMNHSRPARQNWFTALWRRGH